MLENFKPSRYKTNMFSPDIFRANDIRGQWNKDFDLSFTKSLAFALARLCEEQKILKPRFLIGRDARLSSREISRALVSHLKNQGLSLSSIGLAPSPLCYFLLHHYDLTACIVITASHNPPEDNGFKILFHRKHKLFDVIKKLKKLCLQKSPRKKGFSSGEGHVFPVKKERETSKALNKSRKGHVFPAKKGRETAKAVNESRKGYAFPLKKEAPYIASLKKEFSSLRAFPFVLDTGNGALGPLAKKALSALGLKPEHLFAEPDGLFPNHHPDPTLEKNLSHLKRRVKETGSLFGFGFDGDGDRLVLVTKAGKVVLGDELGYVFLKSLCKKKQEKQSNLILADVKCSDWFFKAAKQAGLRVLMTKSGHGLIRAEMEKTKALMALEFSGHIFFNDRKDRGFDDALYAGLRLLELIGEQNASLESLLPQIDSVRSPEIRVNMPVPETSGQIKKIQLYLNKRGEAFKKIDGVRLSRKDRWALFRKSKTQPALTMRFEAPNQRELAKLKAEFSEVMGFQIP